MLPDSPEDRRRRNEALGRIVKRLGIAVVALVLAGALAAALGVPWWITALAGAFVLVVILVEA